MRKNITKTPSGNNSLSRGFTLIEASIFIVVTSLIITSALQVAMLNYTREVAAKNAQRMSAIQTALIAYVGKHQMLPCPAALTLPSTAPNYGTAVAASCTGSAPLAGTFLRTYTGPKYVRAGAVPVHDLGLPNEYMSDAWGRLFVYGVSEALTAPPASIPPLLNTTQAAVQIDNWVISPSCPTCSASRGGPGHITSLYVLLSNGKDGACSYTSEGILLPTPATGDDANNCANATGGLPFNISLYSPPENATHFDDIVGFATDVNVATFKSCAAPPLPLPSNYPPLSYPTTSGYSAYALTSTDGQTQQCAQFPGLPTPPPPCGINHWLQYSTTGWTCPLVPPVTVQPSCGAGNVLNSSTNPTTGVVTVSCSPLKPKQLPTFPSSCNSGGDAINTDASGAATCGKLILISQQVGCAVHSIPTPGGALPGGWFGCDAKCDGSISDSNGQPVVNAQVSGGTIQGAETYSNAAESGYTIGALNEYECAIKVTGCSSGSTLPGCGMWCTATCTTVKVQ